MHGIHHLGMDEPRLVSFAKAVAGSGLAVLTPQIDSLADYHVDKDSIPMIGESAAWLDNRLGGQKVTVTGISFAGGLSLMAALDPQYASHMRALVLMGAYDDLARTSRFLVTGVQELPNGTRQPHPAHDYGASVFVYAHLNQFFPAGDLDAAHEALRDWLWEQPSQAKIAMQKLSPPSRDLMDALINRQIEKVRVRVELTILADQAELAAISPHGHVGDLQRAGLHPARSGGQHHSAGGEFVAGQGSAAGHGARSLNYGCVFACGSGEGCQPDDRSCDW